MKQVYTPYMVLIHSLLKMVEKDSQKNVSESDMTKATKAMFFVEELHSSRNTLWEKYFCSTLGVQTLAHAVLKSLQQLQKKLPKTCRHTTKLNILWSQSQIQWTSICSRSYGMYFRPFHLSLSSCATMKQKQELCFSKYFESYPFTFPFCSLDRITFWDTQLSHCAMCHLWRTGFEFSLRVLRSPHKYQ